MKQERTEYAPAPEKTVNYATILVNDNGSIRTITLNRPERRNAMTPEMQAELIAAMRDAAECDSRVLVLTGAGSSFCAGLDLAALQAMQTMPASEYTADAERIALLFRTLYDLPIPTIAAVQGPAIAGGTGLAMLCDITLATPEAKFGFTEVRIGFIPALVSIYLTLQVGEKRSRDLLLTGRLFDAAEAHRMGLVNQIVEPDQLNQRIKSLADQLIANSPQSLRSTKRLLASQNSDWLDAAISRAIEASAQARESEDFREGIAAFLEKRKPQWSK